MGNLRQSMTDEEWDAFSSKPEIKYSWSQSEVTKIIHQFSKDAMISNVPETDIWITKWIEINIK